MKALLQEGITLLILFLAQLHERDDRLSYQIVYTCGIWVVCFLQLSSMAALGLPLCRVLQIAFTIPPSFPICMDILVPLDLCRIISQDY